MHQRPASPPHLEPLGQRLRPAHLVRHGTPGPPERTVAPQQVKCTAEPLSFERTVREQRSQLAGPLPFLQGVQDGQGVHPLPHVLAGLLPKLLLGGDDVHDVVRELEGEADGHAEVVQPVDHVGRGVRQHPA